MKIGKITCSFRKHGRFIYLKVTNDLNGARKLQQMYKCKIVVIFIKEVDIYNLKLSKLLLQKQPLKGVLEKRCSENMQQIYRRTPMPKCYFDKVEISLRHGCSPANVLHIFRTPFPRNTSGWLLLLLFSLFELVL